MQAQGLVYLGTSSQPYSITIWVNPTITTSGTVIHVSSDASSGGSWSMPMLGMLSAGNLGVQSCSTTGSVSLTGPILSTGVWTYVAITYGTSNGLRLWINGTQYGVSSGGFSYVAAGVPVTITLGESLTSAGSCSSTVISTGKYTGYLDEFQLFSRELSSSEVLSYANP